MPATDIEAVASLGKKASVRRILSGWWSLGRYDDEPGAGADDFCDVVLAHCPEMSAHDAERLRAKVREALEGRPAEEWTVRFADVIIDHQDEPFAKPFFDRSVARGLRGILAGS